MSFAAPRSRSGSNANKSYLYQKMMAWTPWMIVWSIFFEQNHGHYLHRSQKAGRWMMLFPTKDGERPARVRNWSDLVIQTIAAQWCLHLSSGHENYYPVLKWSATCFQWGGTLPRRRIYWRDYIIFRFWGGPTEHHPVNVDKAVLESIWV